MPLPPQCVSVCVAEGGREGGAKEKRGREGGLRHLSLYYSLLLYIYMLSTGCCCSLPTIHTHTHTYTYINTHLLLAHVGLALLGWSTTTRSSLPLRCDRHRAPWFLPRPFPTLGWGAGRTHLLLVVVVIVVVVIVVVVAVVGGGLVASISATNTTSTTYFAICLSTS